MTSGSIAFSSWTGSSGWARGRFYPDTHPGLAVCTVTLTRVRELPREGLGRGFLTGAITSPDDLDDDDWRKRNPRFQGEAFAANLRLVDGVRAMADEVGVTAAQLALAWVLAQGDDVVPIPGTTRPERIDENVGALDVTLSDADRARLADLAPVGVAQGDRYPANRMASLDG